MFCRKCGAEIQEEALYCPMCGNKCDGDGVENDNFRKNKEKLSKKRMILVLSLTIIFLVTAIVLISGRSDDKNRTNEKGIQQTVEQNKDSDKDNHSQEEITLYCPNFTGQTIDSINQNVEYYTHFRFETIWEYNDNYEYSYVYEQSVTEGTAIEEGTQITLYVSMGEDVRYEEVAERYAIAIFMYDYGTVKQCLPYNPDSLVTYTNWPEGWGEWENTLADMRQYYTVQSGVKHSWEIGKDEILQVISVMNMVCSSYGENILNESEGINVDKITKGYQVTVSITPFEIEENERYTSAEVTYTVVLYDGEWKILSDFILDRNRQDEAGRW